MSLQANSESWGLTPMLPASWRSRSWTRIYPFWALLLLVSELHGLCFFCPVEEICLLCGHEDILLCFLSKDFLFCFILLFTFRF